MKNKMIEFLNSSPTAFNAITNIEKVLNNAGFKKLYEIDEFKIEKGDKFYITRNGSSIIAFNVGKKLLKPSLHVCASHSDCPAFKLKPNPIIKTPDYIKLNVERYGSTLNRPWLDRPLGLAGRLMIKKDSSITIKDYFNDVPFALIPSVAPHLDPKTETKELDYTNDLVPIVSLNKDFDFNAYLAKNAKVDKDEIVGFDLYLYPIQKGYLWGEDNEFITSHHIDNLECGYTTLMGFIDSYNDDNVNVYACYDNEEVGSLTYQGADSDFFVTSLNRVCKALNIDYNTLQARGMQLSCDNAHGVHPNHPEVYDKDNGPKLNEGVVIKFNANQTYTTDSLSASLLKGLMDTNKIPYQMFANKSGIRGGGTLGNISNNHVSLLSCDIGLAQWAMHSCIETAGSKDVDYMILTAKAFYNAHLSIEDKVYKLG